jgi:hypothetical protein
MGKGPGTSGTQITDRDSQLQAPEEIRAEIEERRRELGDTVAALAEKADVKARAKQKVAEVKQSASGKKDELLGTARQASPDAAVAAASQVVARARERPAPFVAAGAFVAGFIAGRRGSGPRRG